MQIPGDFPVFPEYFWNPGDFPDFPMSGHPEYLNEWHQQKKIFEIVKSDKIKRKSDE